jgi:hypothetical protein
MWNGSVTADTDLQPEHTEVYSLLLVLVHTILINIM